MKTLIVTRDGVRLEEAGNDAIQRHFYKFLIECGKCPECGNTLISEFCIYCKKDWSNEQNKGGRVDVRSNGNGEKTKGD